MIKPIRVNNVTIDGEKQQLWVGDQVKQGRMALFEASMYQIENKRKEIML